MSELPVDLTPVLGAQQGDQPLLVLDLVDHPVVTDAEAEEPETSEPLRPWAPRVLLEELHLVRDALPDVPGKAFDVSPKPRVEPDLVRQGSTRTAFAARPGRTSADPRSPCGAARRSLRPERPARSSGARPRREARRDRGGWVSDSRRCSCRKSTSCFPCASRFRVAMRREAVPIGRKGEARRVGVAAGPFRQPFDSGGVKVERDTRVELATSTLAR